MVVVMDGPGRVRWERMLLVLAALVGIVAMHSMVGPSHDEAMPAPSGLSLVASPVEPGGHAHSAIAGPTVGVHVATVMTTAASSGDGPMSPMSMPHALMHLCLAVVATGIVLGLLAVVLVAVMPDQRSRLNRAPRTGVRPARPPLPTGARLAQLCVLRN